ncbi:MAG: PD40 domain-containing protein [Phycisphaeraceae bacterium]|nr:MAG: PD40 domain-containing protein [Phycisphaeraceae bacterium]
MRTAPLRLCLAASLLTPACLAADDVSPHWYRQPAISPEGTQIVFACGGDLYLVPVTGGRAVPLTIHPAYESSPVWSPDGTKIAFASDRNGNDDVYIMPSTGGAATRLTYHSAADTPSSFTPDGSAVLFSSSRVDDAKSALFPSGVLSELYEVSVDGGTPHMVLTTPALNARPDHSGKRIVYEDRKGYESAERKHHTSSIARDIWMYDSTTGKHSRLTDFAGEDRDPHWSKDEKSIYFLSEMPGDFNVYRLPLRSGGRPEQLTHFRHHPVRDLSLSDAGETAFSWHGDLYTLADGGQPTKLDITIAVDGREGEVEDSTRRGGATEFSVAPSGKEVAFVVRGDVYVTSTEFDTTRRITNTPEQERSVSFSPDGRKLLYAGERDGSWNVYETSLVEDDDLYFFSSTKFGEKPIVATAAEEFQPGYSPDGKKIAYVYERSELRVLDVDSGTEVTAMPGDEYYSYEDGDFWYEWSPDNKWLSVQFYDKNRVFYTEIGLVPADGGAPIANLSKSGYDDITPRFAMKGGLVMWASDRYGQRSHGSWGAEYDVVGAFLNQDTFDRFRMTKEEYELNKELEKKKEEKADKDKKKDDDADKDKDGEADKDDHDDGDADHDADGDDKADKDKEDEEKVEPIEIDLDGLDTRRVRLTINSSTLGDFAMSPEGDKLYYLAQVESGFDLWEHDFREDSTKILAKLGADGASIELSDDGETLYLLSGGSLSKITTASGDRKGIGFAADVAADGPAEREYLFGHVWRQVLKKFYDPNLHGVDWAFYRDQYEPKLAGLSNDRDFSVLLSEILGELNASHTGGYYRPHGSEGDARTAALGVIYENPDLPAAGTDGVTIAEILKDGPLDRADIGIKAGDTILAIDGVELTGSVNLYEQLNRKAGDRVRLTVKNQDGETADHVVKPISTGAENELLYQRWIRSRDDIVREASHGRLGYAHVRGMDDASFRAFYEQAMGKHYDKEALIVDTRFNGGGWLHDDLATFLTGKSYVELYPRNDLAPGKGYEGDSSTRWTKPSAVLMSESNYSDAHFFPWAYTELKIGPTVGMPVPGTGTAVWWEHLYTGDLIFGIPQVGCKGSDGEFLENHQLEPTFKVPLDPESAAKGIDTQLLKAVEVLLDQVGRD